MKYYKPDNAELDNMMYWAQERQRQWRRFVEQDNARRMRYNPASTVPDIKGYRALMAIYDAVIDAGIAADTARVAALNAGRDPRAIAEVAEVTGLGERLPGLPTI